MSNLVHLTTGSLDLVMENEHGSLDWSARSDELFVHPANLIRPFGPHHYGWQLHEAVAARETSPELAAQSDVTAESACIWATTARETSA